MISLGAPHNDHSRGDVRQSPPTGKQVTQREEYRNRLTQNHGGVKVNANSAARTPALAGKAAAASPEPEYIQIVDITKTVTEPLTANIDSSGRCQSWHPHLHRRRRPCLRNLTGHREGTPSGRLNPRFRIHRLQTFPGPGCLRSLAPCVLRVRSEARRHRDQLVEVVEVSDHRQLVLRYAGRDVGGPHHPVGDDWQPRG